ncbi:5'-nucleotidase C-terminal domain-containing protein [Fodinicurvata sp. EGI_FJ10296]|uniref:bifunctional metallophosphatase/5'-nucleotidase n=1 Tax=Fodinicurvata sp. EGI_FJ10296 TaxID=3231908 RepID=UPI003453806A
MNSKRATIRATGAAALSVATAALLAASPALAQDSTTFTFLHVNDFDRMEGSGDRGGYARLAAILADEESRSDNVFMVHGGDSISPCLLCGFDQGAHHFDLMNQLGVDFYALGNHEFDFGPDVAEERVAEADFPVVNSNVVRGGELLDGTVESATIDVDGFTVGILGLTTPSTADIASPEDAEFLPILDVTADTASALREDGADLVVAIAHTGVSEDMSLINQHAVDLILGGHDHFLFTYWDDSTAFVEADEQANYVVAVDVTMTRDEDGSVEWEPAFRIIDSADFEPDADMAAAVQTYEDQLSDQLDVDIGTTATELDSRRSFVRSRETTFGNLVADAIRDAVDADVAITNGGGIRGDTTYAAGTVLTRRDIQTELPFGNTTVKLEVTGADIVEALEIGVGTVEEGQGRFPQVSGLSFTYDPSAEPGNRVVEVMVDGEPIDRDATYSLATNNFMADGGDAYTVFVDAPRIIDPLAAQFMAAQVTDYIAEMGEVAPEVEGRISTVD